MSESVLKCDKNNSSMNPFVRSRWALALTLADQLRHNTRLQKDEQLRKYAFDIPSTNDQLQSAGAHAAHVKSFETALLFAKTGNFDLDNLSEKFMDLKRTFSHMLGLNKNDVQQVTIATSIAKAALLLVLRSIESIVEISTKNTRKFPTFNSLISHIRSRQTELPIHGRLLVDWYSAAQMLDLLVNDSDWLVQPRKAHWAMQVCNETLTWTQGVFNETYRTKYSQRPIFDRDDSIIVPDVKDKE